MTRKINLLLVAFISAIILFGCQSKEMKKAKEFMEASMYEQAISLLEIEIQDNPKNAEANFLLGKCYIETSKNSKVEDCFNRAILLNTDYKEKVGNIYFDKSLELYQNNNLRYANSYYKEGIKYNPTYKDEFAEKLFEYINNYSKTTTETDKPITIYKIVNNISPNFKIETSENTFNLAKSFIEKGFIKEGFEYADFSIQYDSKHIKDVADIYFNHGKNLLTIQNEPNESIYYFDRCMQLNPQRKSEIGNTYYNQAKIYETNNDIHLLMVFAQKSVEINPDYESWYIDLQEKYSKPKYNNHYSKITTLINGEPFNRRNYSIFPISQNLRPRFPIAIEIDFHVNSTDNVYMLWRYGTNNIISQAFIRYGEIRADFRQGNNQVGRRPLTSPVISKGHHNVILRYDGNKSELIVDGEIVDTAYGQINLNSYDGDIWVGRNGNAALPRYFNGTINTFQISFD